MKKKTYINTLLSPSDVEKACSVTYENVSNEGLNLIIYLLNLCESVASEYATAECGFEDAVRGMRYGITKYINAKPVDSRNGLPIRLGTFLTWYMKSSVEASMGIDNIDTQSFTRQIAK